MWRSLLHEQTSVGVCIRVAFPGEEINVANSLSRNVTVSHLLTCSCVDPGDPRRHFLHQWVYRRGSAEWQSHGIDRAGKKMYLFCSIMDSIPVSIIDATFTFRTVFPWWTISCSIHAAHSLVSLFHTSAILWTSSNIHICLDGLLVYHSPFSSIPDIDKTTSRFVFSHAYPGEFRKLLAAFVSGSTAKSGGIIRKITPTSAEPRDTPTANRSQQKQQVI